MDAKNIRPGDITLKPGDLLKVLEEKSSPNFKFGEGNTVLSNKVGTIPATIGKDDVFIKTCYSKWPFCSAKILWKKLNVKNDFVNDKVSFLDQNVDIILTSSQKLYH